MRLRQQGTQSCFVFDFSAQSRKIEHNEEASTALPKAEKLALLRFEKSDQRSLAEKAHETH
jgi:hypothetical protein